MGPCVQAWAVTAGAASSHERSCQWRVYFWSRRGPILTQLVSEGLQWGRRVGGVLSPGPHGGPLPGLGRCLPRGPGLSQNHRLSEAGDPAQSSRSRQWDPH